MTCLHIKSHSGSSVIAIQLEAKYTFRRAMCMFYILKNITPTKVTCASKPCYCTTQDLALSGARVAPTSEIRTTPMLVKGH